MRKLLLFISLAGLMAAGLLSVSCGRVSRTQELIAPVPFSEVRIDDGFWSPRLERHKEVTLPVCIDQIENQTGRICNFENAVRKEGGHSGIFFDDSDHATGKRKLLDLGIRMADHMMDVFGPGKRDWVPGHEEIELALVKLYGVTG